MEGSDRSCNRDKERAVEIREGFLEEEMYMQGPETGVLGLGARGRSRGVGTGSGLGPGAPPQPLASGPTCPLTIRFTMIILGPSVLLTVKMCISRRQNMVKSRDRMMRPGYSSPGMSLPKAEPSPLSSPRQSLPQLPAHRPEPTVALEASGPQSTKHGV